jgi:hypothetical protein
VTPAQLDNLIALRLALREAQKAIGDVVEALRQVIEEEKKQ